MQKLSIQKRVHPGHNLLTAGPDNIRVLYLFLAHYISAFMHVRYKARQQSNQQYLKIFDFRFVKSEQISLT